MVRFLLPWLVPVALLVGVADATAQVPMRSSAKADPLDARAAAPALVHQSAFAAYRAHAQAVPIGWKQANDTVNRIGGWRAYAREAAEAGAPPAAATKAQP